MTNRGRRARLDDIQRVAEALRGPVEAPDLSSAILARVESQGCFMSSRARALVWVGRGAIAATVALVVLGFTLVARYSPETMQVAATPMPVSDVISTVSTQAAEQITSLRVSLKPEPGASLDLPMVIASVAPLNGLAEPVGAAVQAMQFVGPPDAGSARADAVAFGAARPRLTGARLSLAAQSAWPPAGMREAMNDREWFDEETPLLSGSDQWAPIGPK